MKRILVSAWVLLAGFSFSLVLPSGAWATNIALFRNTTYTASDSGTDNETDNIQASSESLGHTVTSFSGITAADFNAAVAGQQVLMFPEMENADLSPDLDAAAQGAIQSFVSGGGRLIIVQSDDIGMLNNVFGFSLATGSPATFPAPKIPSGTIFDPAAATVDSNNGTGGLDTTTLPAGGINVYGDATGTVVALIPVGQGEIIFLGWDWFDSNPPDASGQDNGWQSVLAAALADSDLAITKTASVASAGVGDQITYTLTVTNNGPNDALSASVTDDLPAGVTLVSTTPSQGTCSGTAPIQCDLGALANGASATIQVVVTADALGAIDNQASVTGVMIDTDTTNDQADAPVTVDADSDGDGVIDSIDNCPTDANPDQSDFDVNGIGDVCDSTGVEVGGGGCSLGSQTTTVSGSALLLFGAMAGFAIFKRRSLS